MRSGSRGNSSRVYKRSSANRFTNPTTTSPYLLFSIVKMYTAIFLKGLLLSIVASHVAGSPVMEVFPRQGGGTSTNNMTSINGTTNFNWTAPGPVLVPVPITVVTDNSTLNSTLNSTIVTKRAGSTNKFELLDQIHLAWIAGKVLQNPPNSKEFVLTCSSDQPMAHPPQSWREISPVPTRRSSSWTSSRMKSPWSAVAPL
jgi:hypothetical protein